MVLFVPILLNSEERSDLENWYVRICMAKRRKLTDVVRMFRGNVEIYRFEKVGNELELDGCYRHDFSSSMEKSHLY
jgi:hypothetical protein